MDTDSHSPPAYDLGEVKITTVLRVEHRLLRVMMEAMADWLSKAPASARAEMQARVELLRIALEVHAQREEKQLFAQLRPRSELARHLVDMMVLVHDEVRSLFEEIESMANPKDHLWTILDLTETHFMREDDEVFPLAEELVPAETLVELAKEN